jgi:DNA-directed RNA polymerase specialized sigma24 family protein
MKWGSYPRVYKTVEGRPIFRGRRIPWPVSSLCIARARFDRRLPHTVKDSAARADAPRTSESPSHCRAALFRLPEEYREPLVQQVLMGFSTAEIATELGLTTRAVLTRLFRGRKQLRALCGEDTAMDPDA